VPETTEYAVGSKRLTDLSKTATRAAERKVAPESWSALCLYGSQISGYASADSDLDVLLVAEDFEPSIKYLYVREERPTVALLAVDKEVFETDMKKASLGEFVSGRLLTPYYPVLGGELIRSADFHSKKRIATETLRNLSLERRIAAAEMLIRPEYFVFDKMRRRASLYPPVKFSYANILRPPQGSVNLPMMVQRFVPSLESLAEDGTLIRSDSYYKISKEFVSSCLKAEAYVAKQTGEIERTIRMYVTHGFAGRINPRLVAEELVSKIRRGVKKREEATLPDPDEYLYFDTPSGPQSAIEQLEIYEYAEKQLGAAPEEVVVDKVGAVLNSTYRVTVSHGDGPRKLFVKKYLNWTDMKWLVAWLWTVGLKNFSVLAKTRMSNEIHFIRYLARKGFNTPDLLHVNWKRRMIFQEFVEGSDLLNIWRTTGRDRLSVAEKSATKAGTELARVHGVDVALGDCKPDNFVATESRGVFLTDLEQAETGGDQPWDVAEILFYTGHYLSGEKLTKYVSSFLDGYLDRGDPEVVAKAKQLKYVRTLLPWTPVWAQSKIVQTIDRKLRT